MNRTEDPNLEVSFTVFGRLELEAGVV